MNCNKCNKWAGAHATLPGQSTEHLCMCPPQRTWVELTDEEIEHILVSVPFADEEDYEVVIRAAVAKLKEKNT